MGSYTALEVNLKLRWDDDVVLALSRAMFDWSDGDESTQVYQFRRMFCVDGGRSFGPATRSLRAAVETCPGCENSMARDFPENTHAAHHRSVLYLYALSSFKGVTHHAFMDWIAPVAIGGWVRWNQEGRDVEELRTFGPMVSKVEEELAAKVAMLRERARTNSPWETTYSYDATSGEARGIESATAAMRGVVGLPSELVSTFVRCRDDVPRALRAVIERYL